MLREQRLRRRAIGQIELHKTEIRIAPQDVEARFLQFGIVIIVDAVEADHLAAARQQRRATWKSDKAGSSGDQYRIVRHLFSALSQSRHSSMPAGFELRSSFILTSRTRPVPSGQQLLNQRPAALEISVVRDRQNDRVGGPQRVEFGQRHAIFLLDRRAASAKGSAICTATPNDCSSRTMSMTRELRVSGTFSLKVMPRIVTTPPRPFRRNSPRMHSRAMRLPHAVVDAAAGQDDFGMVARLLGAIGQVIGIDADAVAADQTGLKRQEIPFGAGRRQHVAGVDVERLENQRQLVHERDVEVALGVFDHLGRFGDLDRGRAVDAGRDHRSVDLGDDVEGLSAFCAETTLMMVSKRCFLSPGLMRSGE